MRNGLALLLSILVAACATTPVPPPASNLFSDQSFRAPSERISAAGVFAFSDEMRSYLTTEVARQIRSKGLQQGLFEALYIKGQLRLEYDSTMTRNAAQAFAARTGNCLSLVIMTSAFAKEMGLPVRYQRALMEDTVGRSDDLHFFIGHVNLTLGKMPFETRFGRNDPDPLTIDFLSPEELRGLRTQPLEEETIVAMYMNNRAAELFAQGQLDDAYWWARAAIVQDPRFSSSYNTLGLVYRRHGDLAQAARVFTYGLEREPENTHVMANLAAVLFEQGKTAEASALTQKLAQIEPNPAFSYFTRGLAAMRVGDFKAAKDLFAKEVERAPYYHEFHFWLAAAMFGRGEVEQARKEMTLAFSYSTTRNEQDLYAAKLARLKSARPN